MPGKPVTGAEAGPDAEADAGLDAGLDADPDTDPGADPGAGQGAGVEPGPGAGAPSPAPAMRGFTPPPTREWPGSPREPPIRTVEICPGHIVGPRAFESGGVPS